MKSQTIQSGKSAARNLFNRYPIGIEILTDSGRAIYSGISEDKERILLTYRIDGTPVQIYHDLDEIRLEDNVFVMGRRSSIMIGEGPNEIARRTGL